MTTGKNIRLDIYACNKDFDCGFADLAENFTEQALDESDAKKFLEKLTKHLKAGSKGEMSLDQWMSRGLQSKYFNTPPFDQNDALRHSPFCLPPGKCELTAKQPLEIIFRSPDWRKQNGFVLFYEFIFAEMHNSERKFSIYIDAESVKQNFNKSVLAKSSEMCSSESLREKFENMNITCEPIGTKESRNSTFEEHKTRVQKEINGTAECNILKDRDFCGLRVFKLGGDEMQDLFEGTGVYKYQVK